MKNIIRAKCLILGDSCVGKSALLESFLGDGSQHLKNYMMVRPILVAMGRIVASIDGERETLSLTLIETINGGKRTLGVGIHEKQVRIPETNTAVQLFVFDCSGKEFYKCLVLHVSEQASLVLLVYDVTSEASFNSLETMYKQIQAKNGGKRMKGIIFGNKTDLIKRRRVTPKAGNELAQKLGLTYFEGSVKEHEGTDTPLFFLANEWFKTYQEKIEVLKEIV